MHHRQAGARSPRASSSREHQRGVRLRRGVLGVERQLGVQRRLVRVVDAGEAGDLARARLGVPALDVALLADLEGRVHEDLHERVRGATISRTSSRVSR